MPTDTVKPLTEEEIATLERAIGSGYKFPSCPCGDCHARYRMVIEAMPRLLATAREAAELREQTAGATARAEEPTAHSLPSIK